jgi:hypothetical protein
MRMKRERVEERDVENEGLRAQIYTGLDWPGLPGLQHCESRGARLAITSDTIAWRGVQYQGEQLLTVAVYIPL